MGHATVKQVLGSNRKRVAAAFLALTWISLAAIPPAEDDSDKWIVVLDAGHGGKDPGNLGTKRYKTTEKDVALDVTLMVGAYLEENLEDVKVIYTRNDDTFIGLYERAEIANHNDANVLISIHCNSATPQAYGTETFVMGLHKSEASLKTAMKENASMYLEDNYKEKYAGFEPENPDTYIALSLRQNVYLDQSLILSKNVQDQFRKRVGRRDRGVKQAGYVVISYTNMPSALVELGFLTNKAEEDFLQSEEGKTYMASAIYRAIRDYKAQMEQAQKGVVTDTIQASTSNEIIGIEEKQEPAPEKTEQSPEKIIPEEEKEEKASLPPLDESNEKEPEEEKTVEKTPKPVPTDPKTLITNSLSPDEKASNSDEAISYSIQFLTSGKALDIKPDNFNGLSEVYEYISNGVYKYVAYSTQDFEQAKARQTEVRQKGYKDAFVVAFQHGERISMKKALKQVNKK